MRIVSLLPACTEWVAAFGAAADLVGRSHVCDFPPDVTSLPAVTSVVGSNVDARAVDDRVRASVGEGVSPFEVDVDLLVDLKPDVLLTQTQCHVCAVTEEQLARALAALLTPVPRIYSMHPHTMKEVLNEALALGRAIDRAGNAMQVVAKLERRLQLLRDRLGLVRATPEETLPSVAVLEWVSPLMTAGHWTPDLIALAGGRAVCSTPGTRSQTLDFDRLREADPDVIAVVPCGMTLDAADRNVHYLTRRKGWEELRAVRDGRVFLFDGNAYFNRPGPRLYRSIELLAAAIYGERAGVDVASSEMQRLTP